MTTDYKARSAARAKQFARSNPGTAELRKFIQSFDKFPAELRKSMRPMLKEAGNKALTQARQNALWSRRIPGATTVRVSFSKRSAGVTLVTRAVAAPNARVYENRGRPGFFRHMVFGNPAVWVNEPARPFQTPAAQVWQKDIDKDIGRVVDTAAQSIGFH